MTDLHGVVDGGYDVPELLEKPLYLPGLDVPLSLPQVGLLDALQRLSVALGGQVVPEVKDFHEIFSVEHFCSARCGPPRCRLAPRWFFMA